MNHRPTRYNVFARSTREAAMERIRKQYPAEYETICKTRDAHAALYRLSVRDFEKVTKIALAQLVKSGECKRPKFI